MHIYAILHIIVPLLSELNKRNFPRLKRKGAVVGQVGKYLAKALTKPKRFFPQSPNWPQSSQGWTAVGLIFIIIFFILMK